MSDLKNIAGQFAIEGNILEIKQLGNGLINDTFKVETDGANAYVLQRINNAIFQDVDLLQSNIEAVTNHLRSKLPTQEDADRHVLRFVPLKNSPKTYYRTEDDKYWRVSVFIKDAFTHEAVNPDSANCAGKAFGNFQAQLADLDAPLGETIPGFHDTPRRFEQFHRALSLDLLGRAAGVREETDFYLSMEKDAGILMDKLKEGILPLRVTHNETKLNNVMLDGKTRKALCVIDLDTVMPGLAACDFGDAIRFGASTAEEDEKDPGKVHLDLELYEAFTGGFLESCGELLSREEISALPLGAKLMTLENGLRFLTDYLEGDTYYSIDYPDHNLVRSRTQLKLLKETEEKWDAITDILHRCTSP